jgi:Fe-Mn family superoxide dismutase
MAFELPNLPYSKDALAPFLSAETLDFHYGKHHQGYVTKLNNGVEGTEFASKSLEDIIQNAEKESGIYNNAAQTWNHTFYWHCMSPKENVSIPDNLKDRVQKDIGDWSKFEEEFKNAAATQFGSGWAWLVQTKDDKLAVRKSLNAINPLSDGEKPLLTCDVWEHAYYIDYRNARPKYLDAFWDRINWEFVASNLS